MVQRRQPRWLVALLFVAAICPRVSIGVADEPKIDLSLRSWGEAEAARFEKMLQQMPVDNPLAVGKLGAVTGTYNAPAMRAGLEALKQGGTAADAVVTTALTHVALAAGAWVSYAGIFTMVY